ncbi:hypothetical protein O181_002359 [Austropuccinia psidii MF-1]|uniref:Uncharacterized protein n=1 Tax=Austropuccinia psidii MF-1 TaxID=1389203 RepID=A0A9Q3BC51_9BASI|nr:hypothetical protein [Austropuccinia psidii MF-1]
MMPVYSISEDLISIINNKGVLKEIRRICDSKTNPDAERSDELDGEKVEVLNPFVGPLPSTSTTQTPAKKFHSQVIPSTPRTFQPVLYTFPSSIPPPSPNPSPSGPSLASTIRPSPVLTSQQLQHVAITSRKEYFSPLPFPVTKVFQRRERWPIRATREDPNLLNEGQYAVARLFRIFDGISREVIIYSNYRIIPGTAC